MMYNIQEENTLKAAKEVIYLGRNHYKEVESKHSTIPYDVDLFTVEKALEMGLFSIVTCRLDEQLVGYYVSVISDDFLTKTKISKEMAIYVKPKHRQQGIYDQLRNAAEAIARARGCSLILAIFKTGHNDHIPTDDGYEPTETVYQKLLVES